MAELQNKLPPGWDIRLDASTGRFYYLNHYTKTTTWDDPRMLNKSRQSISGEHIPLQDMVSSARSSPKDLARVNDTSLTVANDDNEQSVAKIWAMFPTVSDTHIRLLLKKYLNREALVISALQVEKHPITTPGPFATPPAARNIISNGLQPTPPLSVRFDSRGGSPIPRPASGCSSSYASDYAYRNSPKPHSPKLKLRYMKSIFPKAEEMVILEVLNCNDNNIQKASENLREMGYEKREISKSVQQTTPALEREPKPQKSEPPKPPQPAQVKSPETKRKIFALLVERYKNVPPQVITFALESVDYDEEGADRILQTMVQEEETDKEEIDGVDSDNQIGESSNQAIEVKPSQSRQSLKNILKTDKSDYSLKEMSTFSRVIEENQVEKQGIYQSPNLLSTKGADSSIVKGPNRDLLLEDYVKWQGANTNLCRGSRKIAKGSDPSLRNGRSYKVCGSNKNLVKGSQYLAKGSIFAKFKEIQIDESRGK